MSPPSIPAIPNTRIIIIIIIIIIIPPQVLTNSSVMQCQEQTADAKSKPNTTPLAFTYKHNNGLSYMWEKQNLLLKELLEHTDKNTMPKVHFKSILTKYSEFLMQRLLKFTEGKTVNR
jgi:hypothetical protein